MVERDALIHELCEREWILFDQVQNQGGRADCQNDPVFFKKMRASQFESWNEQMLASYLKDLLAAEEEGRNPLMEKYAYMMEYTHPMEFESFRHLLPSVSEEKKAVIAEIVAMQLEWERAVDAAWPAVRAGGRPLTRDKDSPWGTSFETYLDGELKTYSMNTLKVYLEHLRQLAEEGRNPALLVAERMAHAYGYRSLEDAEQVLSSRRAR